MALQNKYVIVKDRKTEEIIYVSYLGRKGFGVKPRNHVLSDEMIKVNEMVIINPTLIRKLVDKKCKRTLEKIIRLLSFMYDDHDDSGGTCGLILDEIARFKNLLENKYQEYMEEEDFKLTLKKLEIIKNEVELRQRKIYEQIFSYDAKNTLGKKSGR